MKSLEYKNNLVFFIIFFAFAGTIIFKDDVSKFLERRAEKKYEIIESTKAEEIISDKALLVVKALKFRNFRLLKSLIHEDLGVRFSPYPYVTTSDKVLFYEDLQEYYDNHLKYQWGVSNESVDLHLSFREYFNQFVYNQDFANFDDLTFNENINPGKMLDNSRDFYPKAIIAAFKIEAIDPDLDGRDWTILRLVFEKKKNKYYLVGIINLKGMVEIYDEF